MQQLIFFIQKYKYFLFFLLLAFIALALTINNHTFHKSKFISSANSITGGLYEKSAQFSEYLNLKDHNTLLVEENTKLKNQLELLQSKTDSITDILVIDSTQYNQTYSYTNAKIIKNNYHLSNNFLTINKGKNQGVVKEMAVVNSKGILGITDVATSNYSRVQSILNNNSKINAKLKNSNHFGTLEWNGKDITILQLTDIPRQANIAIGDTIITGGKSTIFPEGLLIGSVINVETNTVNVQLFNDMTNLGAVYVIKNLHKEELNQLENTENE